MVKMTEEPEDFEGRWPDMDRACDAFEAADCPGDRGRGNLEFKLRAALAVLCPQLADTCPHCGSDCNERDELTKAEREITRLRAEVEALRPFVDRYVWLRDREGALWAYGDSPASIDAQIDSDRGEDAARAARGERG